MSGLGWIRPPNPKAGDHNPTWAQQKHPLRSSVTLPPLPCAGGVRTAVAVMSVPLGSHTML